MHVFVVGATTYLGWPTVERGDSSLTLLHSKNWLVLALFFCVWPLFRGHDCSPIFCPCDAGTPRAFRRCRPPAASVSFGLSTSPAFATFPFCYILTGGGCRAKSPAPGCLPQPSHTRHARRQGLAGGEIKRADRHAMYTANAARRINFWRVSSCHSICALPTSRRVHCTATLLVFVAPSSLPCGGSPAPPPTLKRQVAISMPPPRSLSLRFGDHPSGRASPYPSVSVSPPRRLSVDVCRRLRVTSAKMQQGGRRGSLGRSPAVHTRPPVAHPPAGVRRGRRSGLPQRRGQRRRHRS